LLQIEVISFSEAQIQKGEEMQFLGLKPINLKGR